MLRWSRPSSAVKFDNWAMFWGVNVIGWSGLMLAFPHVTATYLPGWVFNVATLVHGEEAFLAAEFLFTVHFFNNHFRPDKLSPPDVVMVTGTQSLDEFRHDHPAHFKRMVAAGRDSEIPDRPALAPLPHRLGGARAGPDRHRARTASVGSSRARHRLILESSMQRPAPVFRQEAPNPADSDTFSRLRRSGRPPRAGPR